MDVDWADITHRVALRVFGEYNVRLSSPGRGQLRWGKRGSLSVVVPPHPEAGVWYDHEAREGGGIIRLLEYAMGLQREDAIRWLREEGYLDGAPPDAQPPIRDPEVINQNREKRRREAESAAKMARRMLRATRQETHPYLASKGFPEHLGLVSQEGLLYVPMFRIKGGRTMDDIWAIQTITADGDKKFQPKGCAAAQAAHFIGGHSRDWWWWTEGYANGLSIWEALKALYRTEDRVVVAFSAGAIAKHFHNDNHVIVSDHDYYKCNNRGCDNRWGAEWGEEFCPLCRSQEILSPTGERVARHVLQNQQVDNGVRYWQPPVPGEDANDFWQREGTEGLADALRDSLATRIGKAKI